MMTLEEVWENLRQDPKTKATMEEVEKSYKLFKKIENLIVADLEAKLAESEKDLEIVCVEGKDTIREYAEITNRQQEEIFKLKHQLADKEKEIRSYEHELEVYKNNDNIYANSIRRFVNKNKQERNQTAIAELEKVKDKTDELMFNINNMGYFIMVKEELYDFIDQQIKSLKGEV